ncbi:FG-GAP repeat domain-containing protein [Yinghuangia aomiensis]
MSFTPPSAGPHYLHVTSIDAAGNRSEARNYLFYATGSSGRDDYGDLNGDHNTDLWAVDKGTGRLQVHPGQGDGTFGPATDADAADFTGTSITHRGDWGEDGYEDLIVLKPRPDGRPGIFRRANNGLGALKSAAVGEQEFGTYEAANRTWGAGGQVVSLGTVNDDNADGLYDEDDYADLLVLSSGKLWLYYASKSSMLDELAAPVAIGGTDWADKTIMTPGDTTGDGLPELWVRENTTGLVYAYPSRTDANGNFDPAAYADTTTRIQIGTGFTAAAYPQLTSDGDLEKSAVGPSYPDLWGTDPQGGIVEFPGQALSGGSAFDPPAPSSRPPPPPRPERRGSSLRAHGDPLTR